MTVDSSPSVEPTWVAVIPVKSLTIAKSRLGREDLALPFLQDCARALASAQRISRVVLVTGDVRAQQWAVEAGHRYVDDEGRPGINDAAAHAVRSLRLQSHVPDLPVLVMVSDLPSLDPATVDHLLAVAAAHPVSFLADLDGTGTTTWLSRSQQPPELRFGPQSRQAHAATGAVDLVAALQARSGASAVETLVRARRDVDTRHDLADAIALGVGPATNKVITLSP